MASRGVLTVPATVEGLMRVWAALPFALVVVWSASGQYPSLADQLDQLEAERAAES